MSNSRNSRKYANPLTRHVVWTHCEAGPLDVRPIAIADSAGYLAASRVFDEQSCHPTPKFGEVIPSWVPAYVKQGDGDKATVQADLIALTIDGVSADQAHCWLTAQNLAGLVWPTITDALTRPVCCVVLLLDGTVTENTYKLLWLKLAREVFANLPDPAQADFRHRFDYPRTPTDVPQLLRHDGHALPVSYAFSLEAISVASIAPDATAHTSHIQA